MSHQITRDESSSSGAAVCIRERQLVFAAHDGLRLAASIFEPECMEDALATVLVASATGVKRHFYNKFATFLAENGFVVMSFDYRGIGDSLPGNRLFRRDAILSVRVRYAKICQSCGKLSAYRKRECVASNKNARLNI
jgi:hypothetical protein